MRKLTEDEAAAIPSRPRGRYSKARMIMMSMKVGDIILLEPSEWPQRRNGPHHMIRRIRMQGKLDWTCEQAMDGSGWIIKRIK